MVLREYLTARLPTGKSFFRVTFSHFILEYMFGWFGLWCLTQFSTIFQLYHGSQFY